MTEVPSCDHQAISPRRLLVRTMGRERRGKTRKLHRTSRGNPTVGCHPPASLDFRTPYPADSFFFAAKGRGVLCY